MEKEVVMLLASVLPEPPTGEPLNEITADAISFFEIWLIRLGGLVAFIGAIKFAISIHSDNTKEQLGAIMTMISGFMIQSAVRKIGLDLFNFSSSSDIYANTEFQGILDFIKVWIRRVGALAMFIGAVALGFSVKENNATAKVNSLRTIATGGIIVSISAVLWMFP